MLNVLLSFDNYKEHPLFHEWKDSEDQDYDLEGYSEYETFLTWLEDL